MRSNQATRKWIVAVLAVMSLACASTPERRIEEKQALFDSYAADVQENLRMGKIDVGYDEEMVRIALGKPNETSTEIAEDGETLIWGYTRSRSRVSIGVGGGGYGGRSGLGGGVGLGTGGGKEYTALVEFREGRVTRVRYFDD
jgi:hypothetical protein